MICSKTKNMYIEEDTQLETVLLLQHNNPYAVVLEKQIFAEAIKQEEMCYMSEIHFKGLRKFLSRRKIQGIIGELTKSYILNNTTLDNYLKECKKNKQRPIVLFLNSFFTEIRYPFSALMYLKKKYHASFVLYYIDTIDRGVSTYANYLREKKVFDLVYTFDEKDAKKKGLRYWRTPYSVMDIEVSNCKDLYFCGVDTDRVDMINAISKVEKIDYEMDLVQTVEKNEYLDERITVHPVEEIRPYRDVLDKTLKANCILEMVRPGQIGYTLRTFEAVVYNKKLLTNNERVRSFDFYNPQYMKIFKTVDEIDWEWVKEKNNVDYHYDGAFSPIKFIEEIKNTICLLERSH